MQSTASYIKTLPLQMTSSTNFGRYPKISVEQSWNMIQSDDFMVPFAGYKVILPISRSGVGRGIFNSVKANKLFLIINNGLYVVDPDLTYRKVQEIDTFSGDIFMDENEKQEIAICDLKNIYIYNYNTNEINTASLNFLPGYIAYQDGRFISVDLNSAQWRLSDETNSLLWPADSGHVGSFQSKPDIPVAAFRVPGKGNLLFVMGSIGTESWYDTGANLFPYQRSQSYSIDYGTLSSDTIAFSDNYIVWLGSNEKSGPVIMVSDGGNITQKSEEGINFRFSQLKDPSNSYGFFFKQDGHLFYVITFITDNITYAYDFLTNKFYTLCDENMNHHIAKKVAFFNNSYYFVSTIDGNLYELSTKYTNYDYAGTLKEVPRIIIPPTFRMPDGSTFTCTGLDFILEEGEDYSYTGQVIAPPFSDTVNLPRVDLSISVDGGVNFGSNDSYVLNPYGQRPNRIRFWRLGWSNELVVQFRFWGFGRFVVGNGTIGIKQ